MNYKERMKKVIEFFKNEYFSDIESHPNNKNKDPFRVLVSTILSQRTREENTFLATENLFSKIRTPEDLLKLRDKTLENLIKPSGFYRQKAKTLKKVAEALIDNFGGAVPESREKLISLPGVGPKTADVVLSHAFSKPNIAVDVHVDVISKRMGFVPKDSDYETTRKILENLTPVKERRFVNLGFVFFGREICLTAHPKCKICPLSPLCDYNQKQR
ncbi:MAG: endonuclease III [Candidatus Micrarchaeota archaeon]|nr:endonuclease III [Candidatus Micrarchaeota archaeon]